MHIGDAVKAVAASTVFIDVPGDQVGFAIAGLDLHGVHHARSRCRLALRSIGQFCPYAKFNSLVDGGYPRTRGRGGRDGISQIGTGSERQQGGFDLAFGFGIDSCSLNEVSEHEPLTQREAERQHAPVCAGEKKTAIVLIYMHACAAFAIGERGDDVARLVELLGPYALFAHKGVRAYSGVSGCAESLKEDEGVGQSIVGVLFSRHVRIPPCRSRCSMHR